jgi:hypothetical protein
MYLPFLLAFLSHFFELSPGGISWLTLALFVVPFFYTKFLFTAFLRQKALARLKKLNYSHLTST